MINIEQHKIALAEMQKRAEALRATSQMLAENMQLLRQDSVDLKVLSDDLVDKASMNLGILPKPLAP